MTTPSGTRSRPGAAAPADPGKSVVVLAVAAVVVHLLALYWPAVTVQGPVTWTDKVVHLLLFAVPTLTVALATGSTRLAVTVFTVHAPVSELLQHVLLPGRSGDAWDAVLDLVGVAVGVAVLVVGRRRGRW